MNKSLFTIIVFSFFSNHNFAQNANSNISNGNTNRENLLMRSGYLNPLETNGAPYLYSEYKKAKIANNQKSVDLRYNAYKDEVEIINDGRNMVIFKNQEYSPIHILDSDEILYLVTYPYNDKFVTGYLFEVKKYPDFTILMKISKSYTKGKYAQDTFDTRKDNSYEDLPDVFYIQNSDGKIVEMPKTKSKLIEMFPQKKEKIEKNILKNKIDTKDLKVLSRLFTALS